MSFCVFLCVYVFMCILFNYILVCLRLSVCCMLGCVRECVLYILCLSVCSLPLKSTVPLLLVFAAVFEDFAIRFFRQFFPLMLFFFLILGPFFMSFSPSLNCQAWRSATNHHQRSIPRPKQIQVTRLKPSTIQSVWQIQNDLKRRSVSHFFYIVKDPDPKIRVVW